MILKSLSLFLDEYLRPMHHFSFLYRHEIIQKLKSEVYDILIIGGGITGVGIALDAASRGLKVALIEKNDFAFGTSSRSTKLIHGGLRYLKQFEFGLVKEVGSERAIVHNLAPHLVIPEKMLLPLYEKKGLGYWLTFIGLSIYDFLASVKPVDRRRMLTKKQTLKHEPLLKQDEVTGGAIYAEYRTDDARLTIEIAKAAAGLGATIINYVKALDFIYTANAVSGVEAIDNETNNKFQIQANVVVNAAGPWVDELRDINKSKQGKRLHLTKGVHIVVPREKFSIRQAIYFNVDDGRMIFAIPRGRTTYIGTTDTTYYSSIDEVKASREDVEYLIEAVNVTFPPAELTMNSVESSWAGLRPLIHEEGKSASDLSRKDEIFESPSGLISIAGGKLTGYRKMSERVINQVIKKHFTERELKKCYTDRIKLPGSEFVSRRKVDEYMHSLSDTLKQYNLPNLTAVYLVENYGTQADTIIELLKQMPSDEPPELLLLKAEVRFTVNHEMVTHLDDFFVRRTGALYFNINAVTRWQHKIAKEMQSLLKWDDQKTKQELHRLAALIDDATNFR